MDKNSTSNGTTAGKPGGTIIRWDRFRSVLKILPVNGRFIFVPG